MTSQSSAAPRPAQRLPIQDPRSEVRPFRTLPSAEAARSHQVIPSSRRKCAKTLHTLAWYRWLPSGQLVQHNIGITISEALHPPSAGVIQIPRWPSARSSGQRHRIPSRRFVPALPQAKRGLPTFRLAGPSTPDCYRQQLG